MKKGSTFAPGKMAEWSNAAVLKTVDLHGSGGSNPSLSATRSSLRLLLFFVAEREGFVSRWRFGRLVYVWLLFANANLCLCQMFVFENKFSATTCQSQQSLITTAPLRSPLNCYDRSNRSWGICLLYGNIYCGNLG